MQCLLQNWTPPVKTHLWKFTKVTRENWEENQLNVFEKFIITLSVDTFVNKLDRIFWKHDSHSPSVVSWHCLTMSVRANSMSWSHLTPSCAMKSQPVDRSKEGTSSPRMRSLPALRSGDSVLPGDAMRTSYSASSLIRIVYRLP